MTRNRCIQSFSSWCEVVMVGRAVVCGLTTKGEYGVKTVMEMLKDELEFTMALSGCPTLNDVTTNHIRT
ncbi:putative (S)-2-hydroxy-acid oxidase [Helianthus annuus]|uniref:(S)-2-hydroxy-acid oxidase n=1 Tax=Helianthus annuus TaxID=4232 RepID=A0A9K3NWZ7_HELAN|nr:putative (S)-2-hydroxy-acid oxidase [Helianthus annuus]